jgi:hypothetical protein
VVQTAVKLVIEPIFEADLEPNAYGYSTGSFKVPVIGVIDRSRHVSNVIGLMEP